MSVIALIGEKDVHELGFDPREPRLQLTVVVAPGRHPRIEQLRPNYLADEFQVDLASCLRSLSAPVTGSLTLTYFESDPQPLISTDVDRDASEVALEIVRRLTDEVHEFFRILRHELDLLPSVAEIQMIPDLDVIDDNTKPDPLVRELMLEIVLRAADNLDDDTEEASVNSNLIQIHSYGTFMDDPGSAADYSDDEAPCSLARMPAGGQPENVTSRLAELLARTMNNPGDNDSGPW